MCSGLQLAGSFGVDVQPHEGIQSQVADYSRCIAFTHGISHGILRYPSIVSFKVCQPHGHPPSDCEMCVVCFKRLQATRPLAQPTLRHLEKPFPPWSSPAWGPDLADFPTTLGPQTTGDGVKFARDFGAGLVEAGEENGDVPMSWIKMRGEDQVW